jgi:hypothetical protein
MRPEVWFLRSAEQRELLLSGVRLAIGEATFKPISPEQGVE